MSAIKKYKVRRKYVKDILKPNNQISSTASLRINSFERIARDAPVEIIQQYKNVIDKLCLQNAIEKTIVINVSDYITKLPQDLYYRYLYEKLKHLIHDIGVNRENNPRGYKILITYGKFINSINETINFDVEEYANYIVRHYGGDVLDSIINLSDISRNEFDIGDQDLIKAILHFDYLEYGYAMIRVQIPLGHSLIVTNYYRDVYIVDTNMMNVNNINGYVYKN